VNEETTTRSDPKARAAAEIRFAMVVVFPVPGGPKIRISRIKKTPHENSFPCFFAQSIAFFLHLSSSQHRMYAVP
jgi:hypothetical protein